MVRICNKKISESEHRAEKDIVLSIMINIARHVIKIISFVILRACAVVFSRKISSSTYNASGTLSRVYSQQFGNLDYWFP